MAAYATLEDLEQLKAEFNERYEQSRKLLTVQSVAVEQKIRTLTNELTKFVSRKPDPTIVRDFWIRAIPRIADQLKALQIDVARIRSNGGKETK